MSYALVGCRECDALQVVAQLRAKETVECPRCGTEHDTGGLRAFYRGEHADDAREARSQLLADRAGERDAYDGLDHFADLEDRADAYLSRYDQIGKERAEEYLARYDHVGEEQANEVLGNYADVFEDAVQDRAPVGSDVLQDEAEEYLERSGRIERELFEHGATEYADRERPESDADRDRPEKVGELRPTRQGPVAPDATLTVDGQPVTECWSELVEQDGVRVALLDAATTLARSHETADLLDTLDRRGVPSHVVSRIARLSRGAKPVHGDDRADLLRTIETLGQSVTSLSDLWPVVELLADGDDRPEIHVRLESDLFEQDREQREGVCALLSALSRGCVVRVTGTRYQLRKFGTDHYAELPTDFSEWVDTGRGESPTSELVDAAIDAVNPDGSKADLLQALADTNQETLPYPALEASLGVGKSRISQLVSTEENSLEDLELAQRVGPDGSKAVTLLPAGREFVNVLEEETARQRGLDEFADDALAPSSNDSHHGRTARAALGGATDGDPRRKGTGLAPVEPLNPTNAAGAVGTVPENGVGVANYPVRKVSDYRRPAVQWDAPTEQLVVSAEYVNPMQWAVSIARALAHWRSLSALSVDRLESAEHRFRELFEEYREVFRDCRCIGWAGEDVPDAEAFRSELQDARDTLENMTGKLARDEFDDELAFRSEIQRSAMGLIGVVVHVADLVNVDVTLEARVPTFSGHFDRERWTDLAEHVGRLNAICSKYDEFAAYQQLFEHREDRVRSIMTPDVDATDPVGEPLAGFAVVGNFGGKKEAFIDDLRRWVADPADIRDDAPELQIDTPVSDQLTRTGIRKAADTILREKRLRPTDAVVSVLSLLTGTAYDVADALQALRGDDRPRDLRVSELRHALGTLDPTRIVPWEDRSAGKLVHALLLTDGPLSISEWADRADVCRQSAYKHQDRLAALGVIEHTENGVRLAVSFQTEDERHADRTPWFVDDEHRPVRDVVHHVTEELIADPGRWGDPEDPLTGPWFRLRDGIPEWGDVVDELPWLRGWIPALEAALDATAVLPERESPTVRVGPAIEQQPVTGHSGSRVSA